MESNRKSKLNPDVWDILKEDEKTAITLSLGHGKSTWEAGEVMGRAHFKYLEIQKRAHKFIEIFTNHFDKYGGLIPEGVNLSFSFKEYLALTLIERKNISSSVKSMEDSSYTVASKRNKLILEEIEKLRADNSDAAMDLHGLIMDFDRWNNFRILPIEIQEPSAFKRRNKNRNLKHLKNIIGLPEYSLNVIKQKYDYSGKYKSILFLPLISPYLEDDYEILKVRDKTKVINRLSRAGLFIFDNIKDAEDFAKLVSGYLINSIKNCKTGQKFWPEFRTLLLKTHNYAELENVHKSRKNLDKALFDTDRRVVKNRKNKQLNGEDRVDDENIFYQ